VKIHIFFLFVSWFIAILYSQESSSIQYIPASVDFSKTLQVWDGFGFNYVESAQTRDYDKRPQDYGGFNKLDEKQKQEIIELVFGENGLDVDILKMFLDPWHQKTPDAPFDHEATTSNMLYFVKNGIELSGRRNKEIDVITTLYGPPPWATRQKFIGGRDLDQRKQMELANYMIDWVLFTREQGISAKYLSIHNEGEDFYRWDFVEGTQRLERFDYNLYWPPQQVNEFILLLAHEIKKRGITDIGVTNGEPSNWTRLYNWGYAVALYENDEVLDALDLLTTHGFINGDYDKLGYSTANGLTTQLLRSKKPGLRAWITSMSWGDLSTTFIKMIYEHIYISRVNAVIPWAGIQHPSSWIGGDTNLGTAIVVNDNGSYDVTLGYYFYRQLTRAGRKGMRVAHTTMANPVCNIIAFSGEGTTFPDAFVVTSNIRIWKLPFAIEISGSRYNRFRAFRTTENGEEKCKELGTFEVEEGRIIYDPPFGSVTTFVGGD